MKHKISGLFFGSILLLVIITSGCVEYKDGTLSINFQNITEKMPEMKPNIQIQIIEVKNIECKPEQCIYINIGIKNNGGEGALLGIPMGISILEGGIEKGIQIVTNNGKQIQQKKIWRINPEDSKLADICYTNPLGEIASTDMDFQFRLFPKGQVNFTRCFPIIYKKDNPILYGELIKYNGVENLERIEFSFNLTSYLTQ